MTGHRFEVVLGSESGACRSAGIEIPDTRLEMGRKLKHGKSAPVPLRHLEDNPLYECRESWTCT